VTRRYLLAAAMSLAIGCSFDQSGLDPGDGGMSDVDAPPGGPDADIDAGPCPAPLLVELAINGRTSPLGNGEPYAYVLVGDTVELSAAGSCSQRGPMSFQWEITPADGTRTTALPNLAGETITVYPTDDQVYQVSLRVEDGASSDLEVVTRAFQAFAFRSLGGLPQNEIRGVAAGADTLWLAAKAGAYTLALDPIGATFTELNTASVGATIESELQEVYFDGQRVWFAHKDSRGGLWKLDRGVAPAVVSFVNFDTPAALGASAEVEGIYRIADGLAVATKIGLSWSTDNLIFTGEFGVQVYAVAGAGEHQWAAAEELYDLSAGGNAIDPFDDALGDDAKIRDLAVYPAGNELWLAMDGNGVARVALDTGALIAHYTSADSGLEGDHIRAVAIDGDGDAWLATDKGVSRFKRDRGIWLTYGNGLGLQGKLDVNGITIDEEGSRRGVWAGTKAGLVYLVAE
jgi:hypothetical protein